MDERVVKFRVGVMVLSTVIIAGILLLLFGDARSLVPGGRYVIYMHFNDAPGVTEGTPLRKSGILIGRVTGVRFADQGGVIVEAKIDGNVKLYTNEVPQVTGSLLGGDVVIQFVRRAKPGPNDQSAASRKTPVAELRTADGKDTPKAPPASRDVLVQPGDYIEGSVAPNAFQVISNLEGDLSTAITSLSTAGAEVGKLAGNLNKIFADKNDQIDRIVNKTEQTLDSFQRSLANIEDVFGDEKVRDSLKQAISGLPQLFEDTRGAIATIRTTVESVDRNLTNLEGLTGPLGERGEHIVSRVDEAVVRLDELLNEMSDFGRKLNSGEGSLGQLMRNPELYQHLNGAVRNIEQITRELKPILADARVFSDKIARHPELLGVRGAIQKNAGTK